MYIYKHQCKSSINRNHPQPSYTFAELLHKYITDTKYLEIFNNWVKSEYDTYQAPSIDRIDNTLPYTLDNIQMTTWQQNNDREHKEHKAGLSLNQDLKETWQYALDGPYINTYISQNEAARCVPNVTQQTISKCCLGEMHHAGGYRWFFTEQYNLLPIPITYYAHEKVYRYSVYDGVLIDVYDSVDNVVELLGLLKRKLIRALDNNTLAYNGCYWKTEFVPPLNITPKPNAIAPIRQYTKSGEFVREFVSINSASKLVSGSGVYKGIVKNIHDLNNTFLDHFWRHPSKDNFEHNYIKHRHQLLNCKFL